jgi:WD40 repeat protein
MRVFQRFGQHDIIVIIFSLIVTLKESQRRFAATASPVTHVEFTADAQYLLSGDESGQVRLWDTRHRSPIQQHAIHQTPVTALHFSPDYRWVVSGAQSDGRIAVKYLTLRKVIEIKRARIDFILFIFRSGTLWRERCYSS